MTDTTQTMNQEPDQLAAPPARTFQASTRDVLLQWPEKIRRARRDLWAATQDRERVLLELKLTEARIGLVVAEEPGEGGKKRYTNADARSDAVRAYAADDAGHRDLRGRLDAVRLKIDNVEASLECWVAQMRNARVIELAEARPAALFDVGEDGV